MSTVRPRRIRDYELHEVIARGGMATVYRAVDTRNGRVVALKQILPDVAANPEFAERFRHEVRIHAGLHHPNILSVYDVEAGPLYFIAMELAEGGSLRRFTERHPGMPPPLALYVVAEVLRGLSCAHASGIVHRDVKPHNVLLTAAGTVKMADFGISKTSEMTRLTLTGDIIGTPGYMSPEQAASRPLDARTDLFSCGVMLYELLAGRNPFSTDNPVTTLRMIAEHNPPPLFRVDPRIPIECEPVVERLLAKDPDGRYPNAESAVRDIEAVLTVLRAGNVSVEFRHYLPDCEGWALAYRQRVASARLARGQQLLASSGASAEVALWELLQACLNDPGNRAAASAAEDLARRTGYSLEIGPTPARTAALEQRLAGDPGNVQLLLQLAKISKLQLDFPRLMHSFFRLRLLDPADPYVRSQISLLVARDAPALTVTAVRPAARTSQHPPAPADAGSTIRTGELRVERPQVKVRAGGHAPAAGHANALPPRQPLPRWSRPVVRAVGYGLAAVLVLTGLYLVLFSG